MIKVLYIFPKDADSIVNIVANILMGCIDEQAPPVDILRVVDYCSSQTLYIVMVVGTLISSVLPCLVAELVRES